MLLTTVRLQNLASPRKTALAPASWNFAVLAGRLVEVSGTGATLTVAVGVVAEAQREGETVAWVTPGDSSFYPPDLAESGIDLDGLVVVRIPDARDVARATDRLMRSGGFGLVVLDIGAARIPTPLQARLAGLAQKRHAALVCLTEKKREAPSLGSLISLRVHARRRRVSGDQFVCELTVLKDKRQGLDWRHEEVCRGSVGLR